MIKTHNIPVSLNQYCPFLEPHKQDSLQRFIHYRAEFPFPFLMTSNAEVCTVYVSLFCSCERVQKAKNHAAIIICVST
jgi:hypothetical protein